MKPKMPWMAKWLESSQISFKSNYRQTTDQRMVQKKQLFFTSEKKWWQDDERRIEFLEHSVDFCTHHQKLLFLGLVSCKIREDKDRFSLVGQPSILVCRLENLFLNMVEVDPNNEGPWWLTGFGLWLEWPMSLIEQQLLFQVKQLAGKVRNSDLLDLLSRSLHFKDIELT